MAQTDKFDRMNSAQLEDEATQRGLNLDEFQSLANNGERAQRLRDHDAAQAADAQVAQQNAEQVRQQQEAQAQQAQQAQQVADPNQPAAQPQPAQDQAQAVDQAQANRQAQQAQTGSGQPQQQNAPVAPQSDESLVNAQAAASGDLRTPESIDTSDAEQIGGDPDYTDPEPEAR